MLLKFFELWPKSIFWRNFVEKHVKSYISRSSCPISTNLVSNERESHQLTILMNSFWKKFQNFVIFKKVKKGLWAGGTYAQIFSKYIEAMSVNLVPNQRESLQLPILRDFFFKNFKNLKLSKISKNSFGVRKGVDETRRTEVIHISNKSSQWVD